MLVRLKLLRCLILSLPAAGTLLAQATVYMASNPAQIGQKVEIRAGVSFPNQPWPTGGQVDFTIAGTPINGCSGVFVRDGVAICDTVFSQIGTVVVSATYNDGNGGTATGTLQLAVGKCSIVLALATAPASPVFGKVTLGALVQGAPGVATPTGTVTFSDNGTALPPVTLDSSGHASVAPVLNTGSHTVTASYSGDANYQASSRPASISLNVGKAETSIYLAANPGSPIYGQGVMVNALVQGTPGIAPTGTVTFSENGTSLGVLTFGSDGRASLAISAPLAAGPHAYTVVYSGDGNYAGSAPESLNVVMARASTSTSLSANAGAPLTATVKVVAPGAGAPSGMVQFIGAAGSIGTAPLLNGTASLQVSGQGWTGSAVTAVYQGDANFSPSASSPTTVTMSTAALTLTADSSRITFGQTVNLSAVVAPTAGTIAPTGSVHFSVDGSVLGTATLAGSKAGFSTASLSAGDHTITAAYSGDLNFSPVSQTVVESVNQASTKTILALSSSMLTATVSTVSPGAGVPSGTVSFIDANSNSILGTATLSGGTASMGLPNGARAVAAIYSGDTNFASSRSDVLAQLTAVNAASYDVTAFAPDEIVTLFGSKLAPTTASAAAQPLVSLAGSAVTVTDAAGAVHAAGIFFMSPDQASLVMPPEVAPGPATITVTNAGGPAITTNVNIAKVAPGLFTADANGTGIAAAQIVRVHANGTQDAPQATAVFDAARNSWIAVPIDLGIADDSVYLVLYGTGTRHHAAPPTLNAAGRSLNVLFAGAQPSFAGLDQVDVMLPATLAGAGTIDVNIVVDGVASNTVKLLLR